MSLASILIAILSFIVILIIFRYLISSVNTKIIHDGKEQKIYDDLPNSGSNNCAYSLWFFINDFTVDYGYKKGIMYHTIDEGNNKDDGVTVTLGENINDLEVVVKTNNTANPSKTCTIRNIPVQKWIHLVVSIHGRVIDLYLNGKLVRSCLSADLPNIIGLSDKPVKVAPSLTTINGEQTITTTGFSGYHAKFEYYPEAIDPQTVYYLYRSGYGGGSFMDYLNRYQLKLAVLSNEVEQSSFII